MRFIHLQTRGNARAKRGQRRKDKAHALQSPIQYESEFSDGVFFGILPSAAFAV